MKQQLIALALSTALLAGSAAAIAPEEAFPAVNTYPGFADVAGSAWYAATVQTCYEVGLMTGTGTGFAPDQVLTVGEVAAIAARMNEAITGDSIYLVDSTLPWYASYVDYLEKLGVEVPDPVKQATRQEFIAMLAAVVPEDMLTPINQITALPDTADAAVLSFYNAGILTGVDDWGTFAPDKTLTRAETAAMVARVARPELRENFSPTTPCSPPPTSSPPTCSSPTASPPGSICPMSRPSSTAWRPTAPPRAWSSTGSTPWTA